ncbi:winged helix DNA-binding protein [Blastomonas aquatica]|nr:winged helix DNA-binding protein [Blastomonas aquatica]
MKSVARDNSTRSASAWHRPTRPDGVQPDPRLAENDRKMRLILQEQQASRLRSSAFKTLKLRNPTWDMLVALLAAKRNGTQLSMSDLCLMCDAPESTALRLIHQLREKGYAEMVPDRSDRRRTRVSLTSMAEAQFEAYIDKADPA